MLDPVTNITGIINLYIGTLMTGLNLFFQPFTELVLSPLFQFIALFTGASA